MALFEIISFGSTDIGKQRPENEDAFFIDDAKKIFAVADGLGGLPEGKLASSMAVDFLKSASEKLSESNRLNFSKIFSDINTAIYEKGHTSYPQTGIATTLTIAQIFKTQLFIGHVGDTGILLYRNKHLQKLTRDHTVAQEIYDNLSNERKETSIPYHLHHMLTRCLGGNEDLFIDNIDIHLTQGDRILLYTDGVTKTASPSEIQKILGAATDPQNAVENLIAHSLKNGAPDNTTAIALFIQ